MRIHLSLLSLLLFPIVVGCEGNTPRRSPFAASSSPAAAEPVKYAPMVKGATPAPRVPGQPNPNPQPAAENPAANGPITIDGDKLATRRQLLNYHTAIFLKSEVGSLTTTGINENNNFVFRPSEGLNKLQIGPVVYGYKAEFGKAPPKPQDLVKLVGDFLTQLEANQFYVYDPALVTEENKEEMLYLQQYP
jgi:hypothetical protein